MSQLAAGEYKGGGEYLFANCPRCGKEDHFYWNTFKKVGHCKVCGFSPKGEIPGMEEMANWEPREVSVHKDLVGHKYQSPWIDLDCRQYLKARGVSLQQVKVFQIKHNVDRNCLEVPVSPIAPEYTPTSLIRFHRNYGSKWMPNAGFNKLNYMFNLDILKIRKTLNGSILICEGIFDVLSANLESHAVALLGTQITDRMLDLLCDFHVYTWFDWDDAGRKAAADMQKAGETWGFTVTDLTHIMQAEPKLFNPEINEFNNSVITGVKELLDARH